MVMAGIHSCEAITVLVGNSRQVQLAARTSSVVGALIRTRGKQMASKWFSALISTTMR